MNKQFEEWFVNQDFWHEELEPFEEWPFSMKWGVYLAWSREINFVYLGEDLEQLARSQKELDGWSWEDSQAWAVKQLMNYV